MGHSAILDAIDNAAPIEQPPDDLELAELDRNDVGNAKRLVARFGRELAYVEQVGWLVFDGRRWAAEGGQFLALDRAQRTAEAIKDEADALPEFDDPEPTGKAAKEKWLQRKKYADGKRDALFKWAISSANVDKSKAMMTAAIPKLLRGHREFDARPYHFNVRNGTLRLDQLPARRANEEYGDAECPKYDHRAGDLLTRCANFDYDPKAECPKWLDFIAAVFKDAEDVAIYVQKVLGYSLIGRKPEQKMWVLYGEGSNGKSTLIEVVANILGDYAITTPIESLLHQHHKSGSNASPDVAEWMGARLIRTSEPEAGDRLNETRIKQATGGDEMKARRLNRDFMTFNPTASIFISANHLPYIAGKDWGIRRRIVIVPFTQRFDVSGTRGKQETLTDELMKEAAGIARWLVEGYQRWREEGLCPPEAVAEATAKYFSSMDSVGSFVEAAIKITGNHNDRISSAKLYLCYCKWCEVCEAKPVEKDKFGRDLTRLKIANAKIGGEMKRLGVVIDDAWNVTLSDILQSELGR